MLFLDLVFSHYFKITLETLSCSSLTAPKNFKTAPGMNNKTCLSYPSLNFWQQLSSELIKYTKNQLISSTLLKSEWLKRGDKCYKFRETFLEIVLAKVTLAGQWTLDARWRAVIPVFVGRLMLDDRKGWMLFYQRFWEAYFCMSQYFDNFRAIWTRIRVVF